MKVRESLAVDFPWDWCTLHSEHDLCALVLGAISIVGWYIFKHMSRTILLCVYCIADICCNTFWNVSYWIDLPMARISFVERREKRFRHCIGALVFRPWLFVGLHGMIFLLLKKQQRQGVIVQLCNWAERMWNRIKGRRKLQVKKLNELLGLESGRVKSFLMGCHSQEIGERWGKINGSKMGKCWN